MVKKLVIGLGALLALAALIKLVVVLCIDYWIYTRVLMAVVFVGAVSLVIGEWIVQVIKREGER